jgi:hypothetical protein
MKRAALPLLCAVASLACGAGAFDPGPPEFLDVDALSGTYRVTLTLDASSPSPRTCGELEITVGAQITWRGLDCSLRAAGGSRNELSDDITLIETVDLAGGGTTTRQVYFFFLFTGTAGRPSSAWFGPCPGGAISCTPGPRESGSAAWVRQ